MVKQEFLELDGVVLPIIIDEEGVRYYPISYLSEKVLLRRGTMISNKGAKEYYERYIKILTVDFGFNKAGKQKTKCMSELGLNELLKNVKAGSLNLHQKKRHNIVAEFIGSAHIVTEKERFVYDINELTFNQDDYHRDVLKEIALNYNNIPWQQCRKCKRYFPSHTDFFRENRSSPHGVDTCCISCKCSNEYDSSYLLKLKNRKLNKAYREVGLDFYNLYKNNNLIGMYEFYLKNATSTALSYFDDKESHIMIVKHLQDKGFLNDKNKMVYELEKIHKLVHIRRRVPLHELFLLVYGESYYKKPWLINDFEQISIKLSFEELKKIVSKYLSDNNLIIEDIFSFDYINLFKSIKIYTNIENKFTEFLLYFYDNQYGCYMFKSLHQHKTNYYRYKENRERDYKVLVENDCKVPVEKIPLYITLGSLQRKDKSIYNMIRKYYKNLFEITNECYPNYFIEADFTMNKYRDEFDSLEESQVDGILRETFINVIHNGRKNNNAIKINGMVPDWIIITDNHCYFVEYFGMYAIKSYNSRTEVYVKKTHTKIEKYEKLDNFKKLYIYPKDLDNNYIGLKEKFKNII